MNLDDINLQFEEKADPKLLSLIGKIATALTIIHKSLLRPITLPSVFHIQGRVEVIRQPKVTIENFRELEKHFKSLEKTFNTLMLAIQSMPRPEIRLPKIEIPAQVQSNNADIIDAITKLQETLGELSPKETVFPKSISIDNFPPQLIPQPVTNVWLNPSDGFIKSTDNTVSTTIVSLPNYGQLFNRRSLLIYNNSGNTIYWGDSNVSSSTGIPITPGSFSSPLDVGYNVTVYAVAQTGSNDVRCVEISKDKTGNVQE